MRILIIPLLVFVLTGCMSFNRMDLGDFFKKDRTPTSFGGVIGAKSKVVIVPLRGMILPYPPKNDFGSDNHITPDQVALDLALIRKFEGVKGVILEIQSPGGSAAASEEIYQMLKVFKKETKIPIVAYFGEVAGSGGYYIAQGADRIVANPNNITGSIGVISLFPNVENLLKNKLEMEVVTIKSGQFKDSGSFLRKMTSEEREYWQSMTMMYHERFVEVVAQNRKIPEDQVAKVADGRVFHPKTAMAKNLIDQIGHLDTAIHEIERISKSENQTEWIRLSQTGVSLPSSAPMVSLNSLPVMDMGLLHGVKFWYLMDYR